MKVVPASRLLVLVLSCGLLSAAPKLRLETSAVFAQIAPGANAAGQTVNAYNAGDGALSLSVSGSPSVPWVTASLAAPSACSLPSVGGSCLPLVLSFNTASLVRGTYTASVTVSDPHAIDAPQVLTVTVQVGVLPVTVDEYIAPGSSKQISIASGSCFARGCQPSVRASAQGGGQWLTISNYSMGTMYFVWSVSIYLSPPVDMAPATYTGGVLVTSSIDNPTIPVTMRLTTQPIGVPSTSRIDLRLAQGGPAVTYPFVPFVSFSNSGLGTLNIGDVSGSGPGVSAYNYAGGAIVTVDPASLAPGTYAGTVTVQCNGANCPLQVPVNFQVVPQGPPLIAYQGVTDNATFSAADPVAPGDVCVLKGEQLSMAAATPTASPPLPLKLGGARVFVNDVLAPLYYASSGQIAFQMPSSTPPGVALVQVERDGQLGNMVAVNVAALAPKIVVATDSSYNLRDVSHPAHAGDTLILWCIGLGPTNPAVPDGASAPVNPPATVTATPQAVLLGATTERVAPAFAGLSPGSAGLYQVNVTIPSDMPKGNMSVVLQYSGSSSNFIQIAVE